MENLGIPFVFFLGENFGDSLFQYLDFLGVSGCILRHLHFVTLMSLLSVQSLHSNRYS